MEIIAILLSLVIVVFAVLILVPIVFYCDSGKRQCYFQLRGFFKISLQNANDRPFILIKGLGFTKEIDVIKLFKKNKPPKEQVAQQKRSRGVKRKRSFKSLIKFFKEVTKTFKVRRLVLDIDFDDYVTNAQFYPLLYWISGDNMLLSTNYQDRFYFHCLVENRMVRLIPPIWRLIRAK